MANIQVNGTLELKFNADRSQVLATIHPPKGGGKDITAADVAERLKGMGVTYGIRDGAIRDAVHTVVETATAATVVAAQGVLPQDGTDGSVKFLVDIPVVSQPLPRHWSGLPDYSAVSPARMTKAGAELAHIVLPHNGTPGKTLTLPIQPIPPKPVKAAPITVGDNVAVSDDRTRLTAREAGAIIYHAEKLSVEPLDLVDAPVQGGTLRFSGGVCLKADTTNASISASGFVFACTNIIGCHIRARGDVFIHNAKDCVIIADGNVYLTAHMENCEVNTPNRLIGTPASVIVGGSIVASNGCEAGTVGSSNFVVTEVNVGIDGFSTVRLRELEEDLSSAEENVKRIQLVLKPFGNVTTHAGLPEDKKQLVQRLQEQIHAQENRIRAIHSEKRLLAIGSRANNNVNLVFKGTVYPAVWLRIGSAATQIESPVTASVFTRSAGGKSVLASPLQEAA